MNEKKLLLAEGEKSISEKLYIALTGENYHVDIAASAYMGKHLFGINTYDVVVADVQLPDTNGCDFCQYIRIKNSNIPLLMISGTAEATFESFSAGADDYLVLAEDCRELLLRIRALIRRSVQFIRQEKKIRAADIVIDLNSKEVRRQERLVLLSAKEFLILQLLIRNKNRIVPKEEIVRLLWGKDVDEKNNKIAPLVNSLRKKLYDECSRPCIYTVTGRGYLISEKPR